MRQTKKSHSTILRANVGEINTNIIITLYEVKKQERAFSDPVFDSQLSMKQGGMVIERRWQLQK
ncbi:hypothetical protein FZC66_16145 [Priestia megaterium]|nr:hypothetical protein FZC66_16145 [Priestia megaterium]